MKLIVEGRNRTSLKTSLLSKSSRRKNLVINSVTSSRYHFFPFFFLPPLFPPPAVLLGVAGALFVSSTFEEAAPWVIAITFSFFFPLAFSLFCSSWSLIDGLCLFGIQRSSAGNLAGSNRFKGFLERDLGTLSAGVTDWRAEVEATGAKRARG